MTAGFYARALEGFPLTAQQVASSTTPSWWLYTVLVNRNVAVSRTDVMNRLSVEQIETRPLWLPLSRQPPYRACQAYRCDTSADVQRRSLSLPCSVGIAAEDLRRVAGALERALTAEAA
jgi:dTDP-4-amino-4,6-dideoxygalactose transaminase